VIGGRFAEVLVRYVHRVKARFAIGSAPFVESGTGFRRSIALQTIQNA
jgi:hypothetical protein